MLAPLVSAGIMLSYKCNSRCRHCLYCCSPEWQEWMDIDLVRSIFEGTLKCARTIHGFHLAGGEAFLNFPLLLETMKMATHYGIPVDYVETNAGWFVDEASAVDKLTRLRDAGLHCLLVSASPFHAEHIPLEKTLDTIEASLKVFGHHGTMIWLPEFLEDLLSITENGLVSFERYVESVGQSGARVAAAYGGQLIPGGRSGYTLSDFLPERPKEDFFGGNCAYELLRSARGHFDPYGNIVTGVCSGISMGDARDLDSAYRNFCLNDHPVIKILCSTGVQGLYEMADAEYGYSAKSSYAGKCDLCMDVRRHLVLSGAPFDELRPKEFYSRI
jgi:hypothetical protein